MYISRNMEQWDAFIAAMREAFEQVKNKIF